MGVAEDFAELAGAANALMTTSKSPSVYNRMKNN